MHCYSQWKGSVYQLLWIPMLMYWLAYVSLTVIYEYALNETGQMCVHLKNLESFRFVKLKFLKQKLTQSYVSFSPLTTIIGRKIT